MSVQFNTEIFVERSKRKHGNKYDYSMSVYTSNRSSITIICPTHGEFTQKAANHMNGLGCKRCAGEQASLNYRKSSERFISDAKLVHGNLYDYSKVEYKNNKTNVIIGCHKHGYFEQLPTNHLKGGGCSECGTDRTRKSTDDFVIRATAIHGSKYDYTKSVYLDAKTNILVTCPIHGDFYTNPLNHMNGHGCYQCGLDTVAYKLRMPHDDFIETATLVHNGKYDYSKAQYIGRKDKIIIVCPIHGDFEQNANSHLGGNGCPKCGVIKASNKNRYDLAKFIELAQAVHGDKYGYEDSVYLNSAEKIKIFCKNHGDYFWQVPSSHLQGIGCQKCATIHNTCIKSQWIERCGDRTATFYVIRCFNENESFYKYGITSKSLKERYPRNKEMPYEYEIIREVKSENLNYIWDLEKRFGRFKHKDKYSPLLKFCGSMNECFSNYTHKPLKKTE